MIASIAPHRVFEQADQNVPDPSRAMLYGQTPAHTLRPPALERISPQLTAQLEYERRMTGRGLAGRRIR
jgi:hypothetical protein